MREKLPFSEPILLPQGQSFKCHQVSYCHGESHPCFVHFHEVGELILFHQVDGQFQLQDQELALSSPSLVYIPPMAVHNFALGNNAKSWHLVQFSPLLLNALNLSQHQVTMHYQNLSLAPDCYQRIRVLFEWLYACQKNNSDMPNKVLRLLLEYAVDLFEQNTSQVELNGDQTYLVKVAPFIQHVQSQQSVNLSMTDAAALCHMSPSYFSRFFKKVFHKTFSEYMLTYRLHLASHHLKNSKRSVADICYELEFSHPSYFIAQFKKYFGLTPKQYRKML